MNFMEVPQEEAHQVKLPLAVHRALAQLALVQLLVSRSLSMHWRLHLTTLHCEQTATCQQLATAVSLAS